MLCINNAKPSSSDKDLRQNKHQLLHRIASIKKDSTNLQYFEFAYIGLLKKPRALYISYTLQIVNLFSISVFIRQ